MIDLTCFAITRFICYRVEQLNRTNETTEWHL